jgi:hypothetical protein
VACAEGGEVKVLALTLHDHALLQGSRG